MTNTKPTKRDELAAKYAEMKVNKLIKQREEMIGKYFDNFPPTEREKEIYNIYESTKSLMARFPSLIEELYSAYMTLFEVCDSDKVKIGKSVIYKDKTIEDIDIVRGEIEIKMKLFEIFDDKEKHLNS